MVFGKERKHRKRREWKWKSEKMEEVTKFQYLGYIEEKLGGWAYKGVEYESKYGT